MSNDINDKEKFLDVMEFIKNNSDKAHTLSISNIIEGIEKAKKYSLHRNTVSKYLRILNNYYKDDVLCSFSEKADGEDYFLNVCYAAKLPYELLNFIELQTVYSKAITIKQKAEILAWLRKTAGRYYFGVGSEMLIGSNDTNVISKSTLENLYTIQTLIHDNLNKFAVNYLSCFLNGLSPEKKLVPTVRKYKAIPLRIFKDHEMFVMTCLLLGKNNEVSKKIYHFRIDLLSGITVSSKAVALDEQARKKLYDVKNKPYTEYLTEHPYMYFGEPKTFFISLDKLKAAQNGKRTSPLYLINDVFGCNWKCVSESPTEITVCVRAVPEAVKRFIFENMHRARPVLSSNPTNDEIKLKEEMLSEIKSIQTYLEKI